MDRGHLGNWTGGEVARLLALLEAHRRYFQEILASLPVPAVTVSLESGILSANRAFYQLMTSRSEHIHGRNIAEILEAPQLDPAIRHTLATGAANAGVRVGIKGRDYRASVTPVRGWVDSEREALIALEETSAAHADTDLSALPAVIWTMDAATFQFDSVDGAEAEFLGYSRRHWLSTPGFWLERVDPSDRSKIEEFYRSAARLGGEFACEYRSLSAHRGLAWKRDTFHVALDEHQRAGRITGITIDITRRRESEAGSIVANRVEALAGISRRLSHDLNNALMIVTGYAEELLGSMPESDDRRADVHAIVSAAETMAGITGELHGFTRRQGSPPAATDVPAVLAVVAARIREELGASLVLRQPRSPVPALSDRAQLEALLMSIARRLRDKTDPHMVLAATDVRIDELTNVDHALKPGPYVQIAVRGPYVSEVPTSSLEAFLSGNNPHASDMARAYAIVRDWGGSIFTGRGDHLSEVRVLLPLAEAGEAAGGPRREGIATEAPPPVAIPTNTVLVVDDEQGIRSLVSKVLAREGYEVASASSAEEALELTRDSGRPIRLLVADIKLPGKSGRELADALREIYPDIRVLYISGFSDDPAATMSDLGPTDWFLQKPFTLASLLKKVSSAFNSKAEPLHKS